jgi:hypothetical protein
MDFFRGQTLSGFSLGESKSDEIRTIEVNNRRRVVAPRRSIVLFETFAFLRIWW